MASTTPDASVALETPAAPEAPAARATETPQPSTVPASQDNAADMSATRDGVA